jgi:uncharacterized integral membrane protein
MKNARTIALISLAAFAILLSLQNLQAAIVHFLFWDMTLPLIVLIFIVLLAGFVAGYLFSVIQRKKHIHGHRRDPDSDE